MIPAEKLIEGLLVADSLSLLVEDVVDAYLQVKGGVPREEILLKIKEKEERNVKYSEVKLAELDNLNDADPQS